MSIFVNIGMWFERFVIIVTSLHRDFLPSSWVYFKPTIWDVAVYVGTLGIFFTLFLLFARAFPVIAIAEVKSIFSSSSASAKKRQVSEDNENAERFEGAPGIPYAKADYTDQVSGKSNVTFNAADLLITKEDAKN